MTQASREALIAKMFFSMKLFYQVILLPGFSAMFSPSWDNLKLQSSQRLYNLSLFGWDSVQDTFIFIFTYEIGLWTSTMASGNVGSVTYMHLNSEILNLRNIESWKLENAFKNNKSNY